MSRSRKVADVGEVLAEPSGGGAAPPRPPVVVAGDPGGAGPDPWEEVSRLRLALNDAQVAANDANRLLAEVKAQRNVHADEIMLLRAQLKVAVEDGRAGWAAASAARGPTP